MDSMPNAHEGPRLSVPDPSLDQENAGFIALRLVLQPTGASVEVNRSDVVIGRHSQADIRLPLPDVSRRHCRLTFVAGCWQVIDLQSLNGVFLNGEQILQAPLAEGDELRIGGFTFLVEFCHEEEPNHVRSIIQMLSHPFSQRKAS
jgi:pSer/pThr/pTyr-binding forkhead associated (FHA) protein